MIMAKNKLEISNANLASHTLSGGLWDLIYNME